MNSCMDCLSPWLESSRQMLKKGGLSKLGLWVNTRVFHVLQAGHIRHSVFINCVIVMGPDILKIVINQRPLERALLI
jgi:hypothetical protein